MDELMISAIDGGSSDQILQMILPLLGGIFLVLIALHFIYGWLLSRIAKKNHYPSPWLSYVPIAQFSVFLSLGGQSGKHVFWMFLPFVGMFVFFYFIILAAINLCKNNGESKLFAFVLASPFVGLWGLYRLGNPGGGVPLSKTHQALIQTAQSLIQQGRTSEEIMAMMIQAGVNGDEVRTIYNQAKSGAPLVNSQSGASNRKPLSGKMIAALFILGFVLNTILSTIFGLVFGSLFVPSELKDLENMVTEEFNNEAFWDESSFEEIEREEDFQMDASEEFFPDETLEETVEPEQPDPITAPSPSGPKPSPSPVPRN